MQKRVSTIHVVGAGLAGSECALQLAEKGYEVQLYEMRPQVLTPAHKTGLCAELVCSNSLGSFSEASASGQLKWEMNQLSSFVLQSAFDHRVPAGQALGVDRELFSSDLTHRINQHPNIKRVSKIISSLSEVGRPAVIATGPLTSPSLAEDLRNHFGDDFLYFYDAIAPIIDFDSINMDVCYKKSRYDKGGNDYINCPLSKDEYFRLVEEIAKAEVVKPKDFENTPYFESCLPVEVMVQRGPLTLAFGPCKPKGLRHPKTQKTPFAVVQLRQENKHGTSFGMVGFQTKMTYPEQKRIFRMIPGLENAEFLKLGSLHRNLYINTPKCLSPLLSSKRDSDLFFAGQITGVEGYFESTCTGMLVSHFIDDILNNRETSIPPAETALGSLLFGITEPRDSFQPTNINWGLFPALPSKLNKDRKKIELVARAQREFSRWQGQPNLLPLKNFSINLPAEG